MATTMRILGWKSSGLRCPDHEINCCDSEGNSFRATLIQMPNGTGKTTTLALLRAALSGSAQTWEPVQVVEFRKKGSTDDSGYFQLHLAVNDRRVTISMQFDFENGEIRFKTTKGSGQESGFDPPLEVRRFLSEEFVSFYVFDGELAEDLMKRDHTHAEKAVESLFQVHLLSHMKKWLRDYWDENTRDVNVTTDKGVTQRKNQLSKWIARRNQLLIAKTKLVSECSPLEEDLQQHQKLHKQELDKQHDQAARIEAARTKVERLKQRLLERSKAALDKMREPQALTPAFSKVMSDLKLGLDRVKLPEGAAREFFEELAEESHCVCGRPIDEEVRTVIRERAHQYLGSDDISLLNMMKTSISDSVSGDLDGAFKELSSEIEQLLSLSNVDLQSAENERDQLIVEAESSDPNVRNIRKQIEQRQVRLDEIEAKLQRFAGKDHTVTFRAISKEDPKRIYAIDTILEGIEILQQQVDEATDTQDLRKRRDRLKWILDQAQDRARASILTEIRDEANLRIQDLMPYNDIRIEAIKGCLELSGQGGGSVGETLSVGYAFLSTLFRRANQHSLPFVVDSPASPIDLAIRPRIGELVPKLTDQFIAFVISSEREKFLPSLRSAANGDIQYITLFRAGSSDYESRAEAVTACVKSIDGFKVTDETFFNEFQLDLEDS